MFEMFIKMYYFSGLAFNLWPKSNSRDLAIGAMGRDSIHPGGIFYRLTKHAKIKLIFFFKDASRCGSIAKRMHL